MQTLEWRTLDKRAEYAERGEWDDEPDKVQWQDAATGLPCLIVRSPSGALCGYVGVAKSHPWHGKGYDTPIGEHLEHCTEEDCYGHSVGSRIEVHGGLTFSDGCQHGDDPAKGICHVPGHGEPDDVWWFGFDCAHSGDVMPKYLREFGGPFGRAEWESYKTLAYVRTEVTSLAAQLAAAENGTPAT